MSSSSDSKSESGMSMAQTQQVLKAVGRDALFVIERSLDDNLVVYTADHNESSKTIRGCDMYWIKAHNASDRCPMSAQAKEVFYRAEIEPSKNKKNRYIMTVTAIPGKPIELQYTKKGKIVPKVVIGGVKRTLRKVFAEVAVLPIPNLSKLTVFAVGKDGTEYTEEIPITQGMRDSIDVSMFI